MDELGARLHQGDLINTAMNLAALILLMFFPFMIALAAVSPFRAGGAADVIVRRMGLSHEAALAVERLFTPRDDTVRTGWTVVGALWLMLGGLSLAASVQSIYVRVFGLRPFGLRGVPAQMLWLGGLIVFLAGTTGAGALLTGTVPGQVCYGLLATAALAFFLWGGTRVLTLGRLGWREILPATVFTTIGLTGLGLVSRLTFFGVDCRERKHLRQHRCDFHNSVLADRIWCRHHRGSDRRPLVQRAECLGHAFPFHRDVTVRDVTVPAGFRSRRPAQETMT